MPALSFPAYNGRCLMPGVIKKMHIIHTRAAALTGAGKFRRVCPR